MLNAVMTLTNWDALLLAGGQSTRMGRDKALVELNSTTLLERSIDAIRALTSPNVQRVIVSGASHDRVDVTFSREEPPFGGPVAALNAALPLIEAPWILLLPCDLATPDRASAHLLNSARSRNALSANDPEPRDAFLARDPNGHTQWLTAFVRAEALRSALTGFGTLDVPVRRLFEHLTLEFVDAPADDPKIWDDMDTPDDLARAEQELA